LRAQGVLVGATATLVKEQLRADPFSGATFEGEIEKFDIAITVKPVSDEKPTNPGGN
jgi:hypothetical protein